jgi:hypothetical protein
MPMAGRTVVPVNLDDLPRFSDWPKRLLSLEPFGVKHKTESEVLREFQVEKWGELLKQVRELGNPALHDVENTSADPAAVLPCYDSGGFYLATQQQILERQLDLYAGVLEPYLTGASCVVELGAGYGSKLFGLAQRERFSELALVAGEFTQSGRDLISLLATALHRPVSIGHCDFRHLALNGMTIPEQAVIFTSYAVHYVPDLTTDFVDFLCRLSPRVVVHFEPCYEHYSMTSLHGMMCRRYVELNDYARNLVSIIEACRVRKGLTVRTRENVFGPNPFLPFSVIEWSPVGMCENQL